MPKCYDGPLAFENEIADNFYYLFHSVQYRPIFFFTSCTVTLAIKKKKKAKNKETE